MLEVMVTLVVLAVGLLGAALLMSVSVRQQHESRLHTQAVFVGEAMMERMRANPIAVWNHAYDREYSVEDLPDATTCGVGAPCGPAELAARDAVEWTRELDEFLFGGTGEVACTIRSLPDAGNLVGAPPLDGYCDLSVAWLEVSADDSSAPPIENSVSWRFIP